MWDVLSYAILSFAFVYLWKTGIDKYLASRKERQIERQKQSAERRIALQNKILKIIENGNGPASRLQLYHILEPLGFSEHEIKRETNELISEGRLRI